jgi:IS5 family transposase
VTAANVHDVTVTSRLLTGEEKTVYGDSGYLGAEKRDDAVTHNNDGKKIRYNINRRPSQRKKNSVRSQGQIKRREREKSSVRAKVEHVFGIVKGLFGYRKTRYKGRRKQAAKLHMMFALANLFLADKRCLTA